MSSKAESLVGYNTTCGPQGQRDADVRTKGKLGQVRVVNVYGYGSSEMLQRLN